MLLSSSNKFYGKGLGYLFFLNFVGYYSLLLLVFNAGMSDMSQKVTIPLRLFVILIYLVLLVIKYKSWQKTNWLIYFYVFSFFYLTRLFIDYNENESYYISLDNVLFSFVGFAFIPFVSLSLLPIKKELNKRMMRGFAFGGGTFAILVVFFYQKYVGNVYRLGGSEIEDSTISPLSLSYSSSLIIGCFLFYWIFNDLEKKSKLFFSLTILLSVVPFFLGASRGSIFSLFVPFIIFMFKDNKFFSLIRYLGIAIILLVVMLFFDSYLNSGLFERFSNIGNDINSGSSSAIRINIWDTAFNQFLNNPVIGDKLRVEGWEGYPHNILIESFQVVGLIGTIPLLILLFKSWRSVFLILKYKSEFFWIAVIFMQAFCMNMFSGSIYTAVWLWTSMALLLNISHSSLDNIYTST